MRPADRAFLLLAAGFCAFALCFVDAARLRAAAGPDEAERTLVAAAHSMKLSPRGYHRTIKLARTVADLAGSEAIDPPHMLEALQYRARDI